jgi:hypothetical protein
MDFCKKMRYSFFHKEINALEGVFMKRVLILALGLFCLSLPAFAQLQIGGTAYYMAPLDKTDQAKKLSIHDFLFGGEARLLLGPLEGSATGVFEPAVTDGGINYPPAIFAMFNGGLGFDLLPILRLGGEVGVNLIQPLGGSGEEKALNAGANVKLLATAHVFGLNIGANASFFYPSFAAITAVTAVKPKLLFGFSALLEL